MFVAELVGGCCGARNRKTIIGNWGWAWWLVTDVQTYVCMLYCDVSLAFEIVFFYFLVYEVSLFVSDKDMHDTRC